MASQSLLQRFVQSICFQFPSVSAEKLLQEEVKLQMSRNTKRISYVEVNGKLAFSRRTSDGQFVPTFHGAMYLLRCGLEDGKIEIAEEATSFVAQGRSLYCIHVINADEGILPGSTVFLMRENQLVAVGIANHPGRLMSQMKRGVAVKVKHGSS